MSTPAADADQAGFQIDDLIIDLGQQRVTREGAQIPLPHLSFELLLALARAAPNLVTFDQLTERVWPGLVITPETISQRVKLVRTALGDDPQAPRYIGGVRGRGYRMVATVRPLTERRRTGSMRASPGQRPRRRRKRLHLPLRGRALSGGWEPRAPCSCCLCCPGRRRATCAPLPLQRPAPRRA